MKIEINKKFLKWFNNNKSKDIYDKILKEYFPTHRRCKDCGNVIFYYDSIIRLSRDNELYLDKKSYLSEKILFDIKYNLCVCEECLTKKFPEYEKINKRRVFNRICDITCYAFNIPIEIMKKWVSENYSITEKNLIIKHGEEDGKRKWREYCDKQALTNTFEYKKEKYGWNKKQFKEYNKSRAVTVENLINKHGEEEGLKIWDNYIERQRYTCSREYFIEEYGEDEGNKKFENFLTKKMEYFGYSKISQKLFDNLDINLKKYKTYYASKNREFFWIFNNSFEYYADFYIEELNIIIEFNGDLYHANPDIFEFNERPMPFKKELTSKDIWEKDRIRLNFLKTRVKGIIIVWENDLKKNGIDNTIKYILKEIAKYE